MTNLKWLFRYIRVFKGMFLLGILLVILDTLSLLGITGVQKWLIDDVFMNGQYDRLSALLAIFAALIIGYNAVHLVSFLLNRYNAFRFQQALTKDLMFHFYRISMKSYQNERIAKITQYFTSDIQQISGTAANFIPDGIGNIMKLLFLMVVIGYVSPVILILMTLLSCLYIVLGKVMGPRLKNVGKEVQESRAQVLVQIEEGIAASREVVAYHRHDWERERYHRQFNNFFAKIMTEGKLKNKEMLWSEPFRWGIQLVVLGYGGYQVIQQQLSVGSFVVVYQFASQLMDSYQGVYRFYSGLWSRMAFVERVRAVLEERCEPEGLIVLNEPVRHLTFNEVRFKYGDDSSVWVLNDLTFEVPMGKKIAFVGTSGGGKSTIAQLLIRFFAPNAGKIEVNGHDLQQVDSSSWRSKLNIVFQEPYFFPDTIRNNLQMGQLRITEEQMIQACAAAEMDTFIQELPDRYDTEMGERGIALSGGQRQRLALARSILREPEILILDESTSALDMETERNVQRNLDVLRQGATTIIVAHRLSTVQNADIIYVLDRGQIVEQGTHHELMEGETLYRKLVYAEMRETVR